jgi:hypothetical protein
MNFLWKVVIFFGEKPKLSSNMGFWWKFRNLFFTGANPRLTVNPLGPARYAETITVDAKDLFPSFLFGHDGMTLSNVNLIRAYWARGFITPQGQAVQSGGNAGKCTSFQPNLILKLNAQVPIITLRRPTPVLIITQFGPPCQGSRLKALLKQHGR